MAMVCLCEGISERRVRRSIQQGAASIAEVGVMCGAGICCTGCHPTIDELLDDVPVMVPVRRLAAS